MPVRVRSVVVDNQREAGEIMAGIGVTPAGCAMMMPKAVHRLIRLEGVDFRQAIIIKQEMLAKGGEAACSKCVLDCAGEFADVLLMGTLRQYELFLAKLKMQPFGLAPVAGEIKKVLDNVENRDRYVIDCRGKKLALGERTLIMGILNITPDSFSDGGKFMDAGAALEHAQRMVEEGADIIDLGGESTRPGYSPVEESEEIKRIEPVLKKLLDKITVPVSVDTTKATVARRVLEMGAHIINDQWALRADDKMAEVVAGYGVPVILMHNQAGTEYRDLMGDIVNFLGESMSMGETAGISREQMIIDPGFGFGKTVEQNFLVLKKLKELACLNRPVLVGTSRKSMIGKTLDLPPEQRVEGTAATVALSIAGGACIVRVHDIREMARAAHIADVFCQAGE